MKTALRPTRLRLFAGCCCAAGLLPFSTASLSAQTITTWNGGTGNWSSDSLWSTGGAPNGGQYDVFIDGGKTGTGSVVTMDGSYTMGRLTLDAGDTLNLANNVDWYVNNGAFTGSGSVVNNGTINFNSTGSGVYLHFNGAGTISGTGTINFNGANDRVFAQNAGDTVTVGAGQTLAGQVNVGNGDTNITNQGTLTANQSGNTLTLQPGGNYTFANAGSGVARAENGGILELAGGTFSGGTFTALTGSRVQVDSGATVSNATLASSGTGTVTMDRPTLNNVTNTASLIANDNAIVTLSGTFTNNATFNLNSTGSGDYLELSGSVTLNGTGTINFNGPGNLLFSTVSGGQVAVGANQIVAGQANLGNGGTNLTNNGVVTANQNGNTLTLQPDGSYTFTNAGNGVARAENGGVLELSSGTFTGNSFTAQAGSRVQVDSGATVSGATLASVGTGTVTMDRPTLNNVTLAGNVSANNNAEFTVNGTLTNNGTLTFNSTGSGVYMRLGGSTILAGMGTTNLVGANDQIFANNAGDRLTIGSGQTVQGVGNLGSGSTTFTNNGTINANQNGGTLTVQPGGGSADFTNNGTIQAYLGGTLAFSNANGGTLTNNGTLSVGAGQNSTISIPAGALTNLSGTTLTGGTYNVTGAGTNSLATLSLGGGSIVTNNATVNLSGAGSVFTEINALANNQGTFALTNGRSFTTAGALTNSGLLTSSGGSNLTVAGNLTNSGLVGTAYTTTAATVATQGTLASSGTIAVSTYDTVSATTAINVSSAGQIVASGTLTAPTFTLAGALRPGDNINFATRNITPFAGSFTLNGQVNLTSTTALDFDLGGTSASDEIRVNGTLTLAGTLNVNALTGFGAGRYDLLDYTGTLTNNGLALGTLPSGYNYSIDTSMAGQVDLIVTSVVPEPSTWAAMLAGSGLLTLVLRRRVHARCPSYI